MKRIVQTLFLLAAFTFVYGQNFNPIRSGHIPFFREVGKYQVLGLKVDSLTTSGDSTFYHFHQTWDYQRATGMDMVRMNVFYQTAPHGLGTMRWSCPMGDSFLPTI